MKNKHTLALLFASLLLCVIIRSFELIYMVDSATGFFKPEFRAIGICALVVILAAVAVVSAFSSAAFREPKASPEINLPLSLTSIALSVLTIYSLAFMPYFIQNSPFQKKMTMIFGVLFALFFFIYSFKAIKDFKIISIAYTIPTIFWIFKLMGIFTEISAISLITENIFNILSGCAVLVFMLEFSSFECFGKKDPNPTLLASGIAAFMLCTLASVPPLCAALVLGADHIHENNVNIFTLLFTGLFIIVFIVSHFKDKTESRYKHSL